MGIFSSLFQATKAAIQLTEQGIEAISNEIDEWHKDWQRNLPIRSIESNLDLYNQFKKTLELTEKNAISDEEMAHEIAHRMAEINKYMQLLSESTSSTNKYNDNTYEDEYQESLDNIKQITSGIRQYACQLYGTKVSHFSIEEIEKYHYKHKNNI